MTARLIQGSAVDVLRSLPAGSIQTCVTSPPYFGLRDYGTAQWDGGDAACDHMLGNLASDKSRLNGGRGVGNDEKLKLTGMPYRSVCGKCGARRIDNQIGLEATPEEYVAALVDVFSDVRRVLRDDGTCWLNLGDSFLPGKQLAGIPWRVAFALQADGWILRSDVIWAKPNPMPESVTDRPTRSHEYIFLLTKRSTYFYDADAIREPQAWNGQSGYKNYRPNADTGRIDAGMNANEPNAAGRNKRSVWNVAPAPFAEAHFATFPPKLIEPCILAGTSERGACASCGAPWVRVVERLPTLNRTTQNGHGNGNGEPGSYRRFGDGQSQTTDWRPACTCNADTVPCVVLDPFAGASTTGVVALRNGRGFVGIELNPKYVEMGRKRIVDDAPLFNHVEVVQHSDMVEVGGKS